MHSIRPGLVLVLFTLLLGGTFLRTHAVPPAVTDSSMAYLKRLADPELYQGRKSGSEGGNASQMWIADQFDRWGLQPLIGDSTLVRYPMLATVEKKAKLVLLDTERYGDLEFLLGDDYTVTVNSGSGKVTAPVVLVGHGISKPDKGWDDYGDADVSGKIVVILRGKPTSDEQWDDEYRRTYLLNEAKSRGAAGVLFYMGENVIGGAAIMEDAYSPDIPSVVIGERVLNHLFYGTGFTHEIYKRVLKKEPRVLEFGKRMRIETKVERIEDGHGYNVAGVVPGTDPNLAQEAVLLGGHGDHVGPNALGHVYTGADDNGSGACVVMELARVFAQNPQPRTMIFMVFGGEEQGLLGSRALAAELPETYDYITMVNLDMAGRGEGVTGLGGGQAIPDLWYDFYASLSDSMRGQIQQRRSWGGFSSDHAYFREAGIPAFTAYSKGSHDHYHSTEDRYETIDTRAIGGALSAISLWLETVATHPEPLTSEYQSERVVWHSGYGFRWAELSEDLDADIAVAREFNHQGYVATVLSTYPPTNEIERDLFEETLDHYRDRLELEDDLALGESLANVRGNAYNLRGTVFLAVEGDALTSADSTRMEFWDALGLHWVRLEQLTAWLGNGELRFDKQGIVRAWKKLDTIVQLPLANATDWLLLLPDLGPVLFTGDWDAFAALDDETRSALKDNGAHLLVHVPHADLPDAIAATEQFHDLQVHLQPVGDDYSETLSWIRLALDDGLEKEELKNWIGGYFGMW